MPGGWRYTQPESGYVVVSIVWEELVRRVQGHRVANGFPLPPGWEAQLENDVCEQAELNGSWCQFTDEPKTRAKVGLGDMLNFLRVMAKWLPTRQWVTQDEAERRALICSRCPMNIEADGCAGCRNFVGDLAGFLGDRSTAQDSQLKACGVCGCSNVAQVHIPMVALVQGVTPEMDFPSFCWKR